jgi:hypothetical protein
MDRVIRREFLYQPGYDAITPVSLAGQWSSFMNTYAVWPGNTNTITINRYLLLDAGSYWVTGAVDNFGSVVVNGQTFNLANFATNIDRLNARNSLKVYHPGGYMSISVNATNTGGPRGVAVTLSQDVANTPGTLIWSTRSSTSAYGRYTCVMPFRASITAYVWGAGGGGGGMDAGSQGGLGSPGLYNTRTFEIQKGETLEIFVGSGGRGGGSNSGGAPGGSLGFSRISVGGDSTKSFNGGSGTAAGPRPYSGAGGGGGGASGILVDDVPVLVAGGGGGGGGAGNDGNRSAQYARRDAGIDKNAIGAAGSDYRGENGQAKGGDGGGAGGGGGGYPGGQGGAVVGGDASGFAGQCGGNFPLFAPSTGTSAPNYKAGFSAGGARGGGSGQNGRVVLDILPIGQLSVKIANQWKQIDNSFVKIGGTWKTIDKIFVKVNDSWKEVKNSGEGSFAFTQDSSLYGFVARSFS